MFSVPVTIYQSHQSVVPGICLVMPRLLQLLCGITARLVQRLQSVQNTAARLVTDACQSDNITPLLRQLHWLPVWQCVDFKVIKLVLQSD